VIPIVLVCFLYVGFSATGTVLAGQSMAQLFDISSNAGILIFGTLIATLAMFGYRLIHLLGRAASVIGIAAFVYLFSALMLHNDLLAVWFNNRQFTVAHFLLAISLSASWQIAYGPYVADYSRYLPTAISPWKTFMAVGGGSVLGTQISMTLGVFAAALAAGSADRHFAGNEVNYIVGLGGTGIVASCLYFSIIFGKIIATTLNAYGSFMSVATIVSGFNGHQQISRRMRFAYIVAMVGLATVLALVAQHSFLTLFKSFILFLLAFFTPWSAINLVDYYWVNQGRYDVAALSDPDGRYGRWNKIGISVYIIGILIQMPFLATGFYTGPMVALLGDIDISWIIGLLVPGALYFWAMRIWPRLSADA
jgi:NCS1 family nucleobase:cation symporter-1